MKEVAERLARPEFEDLDYSQEWVERFHTFLALLRLSAIVLGVLLMIAAAILTWLKVTWWGLIAAAVFALVLLLGAAKVNALYRTLRIGKEVVGGEMKLVHANSDGGIALEETSARHVQHLTNNHRLEEEGSAPSRRCATPPPRSCSCWRCGPVRSRRTSPRP